VHIAKHWEKRIMKYRMLRFVCASAFAGLVLCLAAPVSAQLRVGAGRVDITPDPAMLPAPFTSIHDPLFTRAILVENGSTSALLMNLDVGNIQSTFTEKLAGEISTRYGIPRENMIISAAHIHSTVGSLGGVPPGSPGMPPAMQAFIDRVYQGMLEAVQKAKDSLQPAEMGFGEGKLYLNVNRDAVDPKTRMWAQESNLDFPSDKTLAVLEFRKPNGGAPIAIYMNYAMHAVTMFLREEISGDFPETASRYIEGVYDDKAVAVFTSGAAGDQNPLYMRAILAINEPRIHNEMDPSKPPDDPGEYNDALMRLFLGGIKRPVLPLDPKVASQSWKVVEAQGSIMGEETLRVMSEIAHFSSSAVIHGSSKDVVCPGRKRIDHAREGVEGHYEDGPPVSVTVGALRIGDVALGRVAGEPYSKIGQEVKRGSPFRETMVVTLVSGGSNGGYMPSDDAFGHYTFQALGTRFKPGCAEMSIVNGIDGLLYQDIESAPQK
jgi:neutral ceramidase